MTANRYTVFAYQPWTLLGGRKLQAYNAEYAVCILGCLELAPQIGLDVPTTTKHKSRLIDVEGHDSMQQIAPHGSRSSVARQSSSKLIASGSHILMHVCCHFTCC